MEAALLVSTHQLSSFPHSSSNHQTTPIIRTILVLLEGETGLPVGQTLPFLFFSFPCWLEDTACSPGLVSGLVEVCRRQAPACPALPITVPWDLPDPCLLAFAKTFCSMCAVCPLLPSKTESRLYFRLFSWKWPQIHFESAPGNN